MVSFFQKGEKLLGVERGKRKYDLPLDKTEGTGFLKILILMMTILAVMAFAVFFVLSEITDRWTSGLENKATLEIPAQDANGNAINQTDIQDYLDQAATILRDKPYISAADIMSKDDIQALVAPWLGEDTNFNDIPLPGLISISFKPEMEAGISALTDELQTISPMIRIDTHQSWLSDVLRFAGALKFGSVLLLSIIGVITFSAVAGAVKARIAVHKDEVELLHLIGATDQYITGQFQKHTAWMTLQSAAVGTLIGLVALFMVGKIAGKMDIALLPDFSISALQQISFLILPIFIAALAMLTARITVLHALRRMP